MDTGGNTQPEIIECSFEDIKKWTSLAAKDHVSLKQSNNTQWFKYSEYGCAGLMQTKTSYRIKSVFIKKEYRGQGFGSKLTEYLLSLKKGFTIEVLAYNDKFYLDRGFKFIKMYRPGVFLLRK